MPVLAPDHAAVAAYYAELDRYAAVGAAHEQAVKSAFHAILQTAASAFDPDGGWTLVPEFSAKTKGGRAVRYDGALRDTFRYTLGFWEAKDSADDLDREIQRKIERGYSLRNTLFQAPQRAVLYQDGRVTLDADLTAPRRLVEVLDLFLGYQAPQIAEFRQAVAEFKAVIPDLAAGLLDKIQTAQRTDPAFRAAFEGFVATVREAVNPNVAPQAVQEMLIQHLLTERVVRTVFGNRDFARRNAIAREIETVIDALTARHMSREDFLGRLDRFYRAIEETATGIADFAEKQDFLNTVYEQFFQGFSDRVADTHGIVYTPQPLVDFMVRSVDALLDRHFGQRLADVGVHVLDPFVGTGNFLVRVMEEIPAPALPPKYGVGGQPGELHANEVMLLPYYVASLNIEHAYREKVGSYAPFEGIVLVDTFEMIEGKTLGMFSAENSERAQRQRNAPIKVILGNPPYNAHQVNANDANQNRKYKYLDQRVSDTYAQASSATLRNSLADPYVKAFRWAADRLGDQGVVAYVTNSSFVDKLAFDGMRKHLAAEFDEVWVVDLGGDIVSNPRLSGTTHNVFGIKVGVAITFLVRTRGKGIRPRKGHATIHYAEAGADWKRQRKYDWLEKATNLDGLDWRVLTPNRKNRWLVSGTEAEFDEYLPLCSKAEKASEAENETTILDEYCPGVNTSRDAWVYDFERDQLAERVEQFVDTYNAAVVKWQRKGGTAKRVEDVVTRDDTKIKWSRDLLKRHLKSGRYGDFDDASIRRAMYRPYMAKWLYYDDLLIDSAGLWGEYFPSEDSDNRVIVFTTKGSQKPFMALMVDQVADYHVVGAGAGAQCLPFYLYREDGTREENLTDWALGQFRARYADAAITKRDVFHYVYAVLHHPAYRARYAADLKRSLPRIPYASTVAEGGPGFRPFAEAGRALAALHVGYEAAAPYPLALAHAEGTPLTYRVEKMRLDEVAGTLRLNASLTLTGVPEAAHRYRLGNRSALGWLVDQLRVKTDKRSGITHDPNAAFDGDALVDLVRRVTTVSVETVQIVEALPPLGLPGEDEHA